MVAMPGRARPQPARQVARAAATAAVALVLLALLRWGSAQQRRASDLVRQPVGRADLAGSPSLADRIERAAQRSEQAAAAGASTRTRSDDSGSSGGGSSSGAPATGGTKSTAEPARKEESAAGKEAVKPSAAEQAAVPAEPEAQPAAAAGGEAAPAAAAAAPAVAGGGQQLEQVEKVDIAAKASTYLGFQLLLRAQATPFRRCKVTSFQPKPLNDAQVTAVLQDSSKLAGQLFWAEVGSVPCRKDGCCKQLFSFRYGTTDVLVFQQIFRDHYLRALYSLFPEDAAPKYILDAGANAGYATALFKLLWPDATVVSLEPDPGNFAQLRRNTAGFSGVHRLNAGLWGRQANITLSSNGGRGEEWGKTFRETQPGETGVPAYSVNDVAQMFNIPKFDFVKIDIEGAEGRVFVLGADLRWLGGPRVVSLEIHDFFAERFGMTAVSGHVDAAFAQHPNYQIARDNEHVFFIDSDQLAAANLSAKPAGGTP